MPKIDAQYYQDAQDTPQPQYYPDYEEPCDAQDARKTLDAKAAGDAVDP